MKGTVPKSSRKNIDCNKLSAFCLKMVYFQHVQNLEAFGRFLFEILNTILLGALGILLSVCISVRFPFMLTHAYTYDIKECRYLATTKAIKLRNRLFPTSKVLYGLNSLGGARFSKLSIPLLMKLTSLASLMADKTSSLLGPPRIPVAR